jgi:uncharacterized protein (DUF983 family)
MDRCRACNSSIKSSETACFSCGTEVGKKDTGAAVAARFVLLSKIVFIVSATMTVASLFFSATPPFWKCLVATIVLMFVKSSAEQMLEKHKS